MSTVIRIENLWKEYRLGVISHGTLAQDIQSKWARLTGKEDPNSKISSEHQNSTLVEDGKIWALKDINLEIEEGEVIGFIGKNGAGKSTLLKILSKVTAPTKGQIFVKGRIASLLEVGTGFHPELTGLENVYMNGAILGMSKKEIKSKHEEIIDFSGVEKYIDTPVKRYSSGMRVRLAFAVAAHLDPEILVVDEVLAVGDVEFQKKCLGRMSQVSQEGRTVLFVSHNLSAINRICGKAGVMNHGELVFQGTSAEGVSYYLNHFAGADHSDNGGYNGNEPLVLIEDKLKDAQFTELSLVNSRNGFAKEFEYYEDLFLQMHLVVHKARKDYYVLFTVKDLYENIIYVSTDSDFGNSPLNSIGVGKIKYSVKLPQRLLKPGQYTITVSITTNNKTAGPVDRYDSVLSFSITDSESYRATSGGYRKAAVVAPEIKWELTNS